MRPQGQWLDGYVCPGGFGLGGSVLPHMHTFMFLGTTESLVPGEEQSVIRWAACWDGLYSLKSKVWCYTEEGSWRRPLPLWLFLDTGFEPATVTLLPSEIRWGIWACNSPTYTLPGGYTLSDLP